MEAIQLSPAELELIRIKRAEAENAIAKQKAQLQVEREKGVVALKIKAESFKKEKLQINEILRTAFSILAAKFPGTYTLVTSPASDNFKYEPYYSTQEREELGIVDSFQSFTYATETVEYAILEIKRVDNPKYIIKGGSKRGTTVFGMFLHGIDYKTQERLLTNVLTAHKNIEEHLNTNNKKKSQEELDLIGWDMLLEDLQNEFSKDHAIFEKKEETKSYQSSPSKREYYTVRQVVVTFPNQLQVIYNFRYYIEPTTNQPTFKREFSSMNSSKLDRERVIEALKNL